VSNHATFGGQRNDSGLDLFKLFMATIPAVVLYFVGWAYLHFYLKAFGISVSELDLDIQTILIYSFPPLQILVRSWWHWLVLGLVALLVIVWLVRRFAVQDTKEKLANVCNRTRSASPVTQGLGLLVILLILVVVFVPIIGSAAAQAANRKWVSEGVLIEAVVKEPDAKEKSAWHENYKRCGSRRALDLIFVDKESYYMLCISSLDKASALVFEIRRQIGLVSVRFVRREN